MTPEFAFQKQCLEPLLPLFQSYEIPARLLEPDAAAPYYTLVAKFPAIGRSDYEVAFELTLPPGTADIKNGNYLLMFMGTLDKEVWKDSLQGLTWMCNKLNTRLSLGSFVVLEEEAQLLFRQATILNGSLSTEQKVQLIDQQLGMIVHQLNLFIDALMEVAAGREEPDAALKGHPLGPQLFPNLK